MAKCYVCGKEHENGYYIFLRPYVKSVGMQTIMKKRRIKMESILAMQARLLICPFVNKTCDAEECMAWEPDKSYEGEVGKNEIIILDTGKCSRLSAIQDNTYYLMSIEGHLRR